MKTFTTYLALSLALAATAQTTPKKTTTQAPKQDRIVKGTVQLAGDNGQLGTTYTIGKQDPINITLTGVRYSVIREVVGTDVIAPNKEEKLLVLDFTAHNPNPKEINFSGAMLKFTGVDQESVNREYTGNFTRAKTGEIFYANLKPAQKVELRTIIKVPADGTVPKLMLEHRSGGAVLRYDLRPHLKPLTAPFNDPKDETGMTAIDTYKCDPDVYYPMEKIDIKLATDATLVKHGGRFSANTVDPDRSTFASVKFVLRGQSPQPAFLRFEGEFIDEDGGKYPITRLAPASAEEHLNQRVELGDELTMRFVGVIPAKVKIKALKIVDTSGSKSRTYIFPLVPAK